MVSRWQLTVSLPTTRWALFKQSSLTRLVILSIWYMPLEASRLLRMQMQRLKTWSWKQPSQSTLQGMMSQFTRLTSHSTMLTSKSNTGSAFASEVEEESISMEWLFRIHKLFFWQSLMFRNNASLTVNILELWVFSHLIMLRQLHWVKTLLNLAGKSHKIAEVHQSLSIESLSQRKIAKVQLWISRPQMLRPAIN